MPQFRTIEEFVKLLEDRQELCKFGRNSGLNPYQQGKRIGEKQCLQFVLSILRTSNLGIVHPPSEDKS